MHRLHLFVDGVYGCACLSILQVVSNGMFWSFSFEMCLLSSVLCSFSLLVKVPLWDVYRVLKLLAVSPMYFLLLLGVVTVASYITFCVVDFPGRGHFYYGSCICLLVGCLLLSGSCCCVILLCFPYCSCSCSSASGCSCYIFAGVHGLGESAVRLKPGTFFRCLILCVRCRGGYTMLYSFVYWFLVRLHFG